MMGDDELIPDEAGGGPEGDAGPRPALAAARPSPLGRRLVRESLELQRRRAVVPPWAAAAVPLIEAVAGLPVPSARRFGRQEVLPRRAAAALPAQPLPHDVRERLVDVVGPGAREVRVREDDVADRAAREHRADALAVGREVLFRAGQYRPREDKGFALLAHEALHVSRVMRPDAAWRRATAGGVREEEAEAAALEQAMMSPPPRRRNGAAVAAPPGGPAVPAPRPVDGAPTLGPLPPALRPLAAATDRPTDAPPAAQTSTSFEDLRAALYRDLMSSIRSDFERGA
jgi:hypothetical protein